MGDRRQRPARREPGPHLVHHGHHEDRPRRPGQAAAWPWGSTRPPATAPSPSPRWPPGSSPARYGLRPEPFYLGLAFAALGLGLSTLFVRETRGHARHEAASHIGRADHLHGDLTTGEVFLLTVVPGEGPVVVLARPAWSTTSTTASPGACSRSTSPPPGCRSARIGILAALYPAVWGLGQLVTGGLSDRIGRKPLIAGGMLAPGRRHRPVSPPPTASAIWALGAVLLGAGTAMVYPTLLAAIGDVAHPSWRARSVGIYRLWRDGGFAVGALLAGVLADAVRHQRRHLGRRRAHRRLGPRRRRSACTRPTPATTAPRCPTTPTSRAEPPTDEPTNASPLLRAKAYDQPSVFEPARSI